LKIDDLSDFVSNKIKNAGLKEYGEDLRHLFFNVVEPNVSLDYDLTKKDLEAKINNLSYTKGIVSQGSQIISKGEVIDGKKLQILKSLKDEYQSNVWSASNYFMIVSGYALLVAVALFMLFLFMQKYCADIFENNKEVTFVFFNILIVVALTVAVMKM